MSAIIKQLTDKEGANDLLPITNTKAVYDDNGNRLDNLLKQNRQIKIIISTYTTDSNGLIYFSTYSASKIIPLTALCAYSGGWLFTQIGTLNNDAIGFRMIDANGNAVANTELTLTIFYLAND